MMTADLKMKFTYTNHRGETSQRTVQPHSVWFGTTKWHPEAQWFLKAYDLDKSELRDFAMADITAIER